MRLSRSSRYLARRASGPKPRPSVRPLAGGTLAASLIGDSLGVAGAHADLSACRKIRPAWSDTECGGSESSTGGQSTKPTRHLEIRGPGKIGFAGYGRQPAGGMEP